MKKFLHHVTLVICGAVLPLLAIAGPVDINSLTKATAIVEYRKENGPFRSVDQLAEVKGIGARTIEINRENILLAPPAAKK